MKQSTIKKLINLNHNLYTKEASDWDKSRDAVWEKPLIDFTESIKPNDNILDIGCGNARLYQLFQGKTITYTGIDESKTLISLCQKKYPDANFIAKDGLTIDYHNQFDYVFCIAVLHHIPSHELQLKFLTNIYKSLKPNGTIFLTVWNRYQKKYLKYFDKTNLVCPSLNEADITDLKINDLIIPWRKTTDFRYVHAFTKNELEVLATECGFKEVKVSYGNKYDETHDVEKGLFLYLIAKK